MTSGKKKTEQEKLRKKILHHKFWWPNLAWIHMGDSEGLAYGTEIKSWANKMRRFHIKFKFWVSHKTSSGNAEPVHTRQHSSVELTL